MPSLQRGDPHGGKKWLLPADGAENSRTLRQPPRSTAQEKATRISRVVGVGLVTSKHRTQHTLSAAAFGVGVLSRSVLRAHHHHQSTPAWLTRRTSVSKYSAPSAMQICQQPGGSSTKVCGILMTMHARNAQYSLFVIAHRMRLHFSDIPCWSERPLYVNQKNCNHAEGKCCGIILFLQLALSF